MARGDGSASAAGRGRPRSAWVWLGLGWLGVLAWLAMLAVNAAPYLGGRQWPPASVLLPRLLAPPAALGLPAAQATPLLTALAIFLIIVVAALTISSRSRVSAAPAVSTPAPTPQPPAERALEPAAEAVSDAPESTPPAEVAPEPPAPAPEPPAPTSQRAAFTPRVFISHSSADDGFGKRLAADLRAALAPADPGRVWYDSAPQRAEEVAKGEDDAEPGGLKGGMNFPREIVEQIAARNVMIVILSPEAARSRWVRYEIDQAINRYNGPERFAIYPLVYRVYPLPKAIATFQTLDFTNADSAAYQRQLGELVALIREGRVNLSESAPPFELGALPPPERLIGRDEELAWALTRLRARETTAVTAIGGMGGIGKSALAAVAVRLLRQERAFPDGIVAVSCENQTDPVAVLRAALTPFTAGQRTPDADSLPALGAIAANLLEGKRALIALDNIEPDLRVEQVTTPLTDAGATLLLTARQMLPGAAVPPDGVRRLDLLSAEDALLLFARSYGRADADALSDEQRTAATRIVALLDRHTLAVRLAGAYAAEMNRPLPRVADEIASDTLDIPEGETPRKVEAVLARSVDALPPEGQRLFAVLAIFATGEFGRKAALALAEGLALSDPKGSVELLVRRALLDASVDTSLPTDADAERLRLHPLFQAEAAPRFAAWPAADREAAQRAVAAWYARYADNVATPNTACALDEANIGGALAWAVAASEDRLLARLCNGMATYWRIRGRTDDRRRYLPLAVAAAQHVATATGERDDRLQAAQLEEYYADLQLMLGDVASAKAVYERNIQTYAELGDQFAEGVALGKLGDLALRAGDVAAARTAYERYLAIMRAVGDQQQEGVALSLLGDLALRAGDAVAARDAYERYLAIMRAVGDQQQEGVALYKLALLLEAQGELGEAEDYHRQSLAISRRVQHPQDEADSLLELGQFLLRHGRGGAGEARGMLLEAAAIYERLGMAEEAAQARAAAEAAGGDDGE